MPNNTSTPLSPGAASPQALLRLPAVIALVGLRRSTIYHMVQAGEFPAPVRLGPRCVGWPSSEVSAWIDARIAAPRVLAAQA